MVTGCKVIRVVDGDTVELGCPDAVWPGGRADAARIVGYDSPELFSPQCPAEEEAATEAKAALARLLRQGEALVGGAGTLEVAFLGTDTYGRWLVDMRVGGERVSTVMVAGGHGRRYLGGLRGGWC